MLGESSDTVDRQDGLSRDQAIAAFKLARASAVAAQEDLSDVHSKLVSRARLLAKIRLTSGAISSLSSAGLLAFMVSKNVPAQLPTAVAAFAAGLFGLVSTYLEDYSGGDGSVRRLREVISVQVRRLAEANGQINMAEALQDQTKVVAALGAINEILSEVQFARAQIGLAV